MTNWTKQTDYLPNGFNLRSGAGGGDPANGLCFMELTALMAGEPISDHPECACPVLTSYGIKINDRFDNAERQALQPLSIMMAGTKSKSHKRARLFILARTAVDVARLALPIYEAEKPGDKVVRKAIEAARACLENPCKPTAYAASRAASAADAASASRAADAASASRAAAYAASAAAYASCGSADAAYASADAASAAASAAYASAGESLRAKIVETAIAGLREAIEAGPHTSIEQALAVERVMRVKDALPLCEAPHE